MVTSYYVNRSDQFPVDFRLYHQFNRKYEKQVLQQVQEPLASAPTLANYRQYLATLVSQHYRQKLYQPKTRLGAELVQQAIAWNIPFSVVLFDSWFLRWPLIAAIEATGKDWIGACPKDRLILHKNRWTQLQTYILSNYGRKYTTELRQGCTTELRPKYTSDLRVSCTTDQEVTRP